MRLTTACPTTPRCPHDKPHAGDHLEVSAPSSTYCAPARCYCGDCPGWTPPPLRLGAVGVDQLARLREVRAELDAARAAS